MTIDVTSLVGRRATHRWERINIGDILERNTWGRADKVALIARPGAFADPRHARLTYREADRLANRVANALIARGLTPGDRVVLFCENSAEALLTKLGLAKAGLVGAPLNPNLAPDVIDVLLARLEPRFVIADAELAPRLLPSLERAGIPLDVTVPIGGDAVAGSTGFTAFVDAASDVEPDVETHGDDIWEILFTSGTTAAPKGAMMSHTSTQLAAMNFGSALTRGLPRETDLVLVNFLPFVYHVADHIYTLPAFASGGTLVVGRRVDGAAVAAAIAEEGATALWGGNPAMLTAVADAAEQGDGLPTLTFAGYGWASIAPDLHERFRKLAHPQFQFMTHLGQTEAISCLRFYLGENEEKFLAHAPDRNFVGRPNPLLASRLIDAEGGDITGPEIAGEVVYRSPVVTAGYYRDADATAEAFAGGWFHSGDSCVLDEDGDRVLVDRYKDIVKTGGENVPSIRVENVLNRHPTVERAAVVGLPHERWGEAVTAFVVPAAGAAVDEAELIAHCKGVLAGFEVPKAVIAIDALPVTVGAKILKYRLRADHQTHYSTSKESTR